MLNASKSLINSEQLGEVSQAEPVMEGGGQGGKPMEEPLELPLKLEATNTIQNEADKPTGPGPGPRPGQQQRQHRAKMETTNFGVFEQRLVPGRWSHGNQLFTFRARFCFAVSALALIFGAFLPSIQ